MSGILLDCERAWLLAQPHKPLAVGQAMSVILQATDLDTQIKTTVDKTISTFTYEFGACNRIYNTAISAAYTKWVSVPSCGTVVPQLANDCCCLVKLQGAYAALGACVCAVFGAVGLFAPCV